MASSRGVADVPVLASSPGRHAVCQAVTGQAELNLLFPCCALPERALDCGSAANPDPITACHPAAAAAPNI